MVSLNLALASWGVSRAAPQMLNSTPLVFLFLHCLAAHEGLTQTMSFGCPCTFFNFLATSPVHAVS